MKKTLLFLYLFTAVLTACKTTVPKKNPKENNLSSPKLTQEQQIQNTSLFLDALREKFLGNDDKAIALFSQVIKQNPDNDGALFELSLLLYQTNKYDDALVFAKEAIKLKPEVKWYRMLLAEIFTEKRDYDEASKVYKQLTELFPANETYYLEWADLNILAGRPADAIKIYDQYEKQFGIQPEITIQKEKIYVKMGKISKAIEEIQKLVKEFPDQSSYFGVLAELYIADGQPLKALELYQHILKINPDDPYVHLSLADYYKAQNNDDKTFEELKLAFANPDLDIDTKVKILMNLFAASELDKKYRNEINELAKVLVETSPNEAKAFSIYGDILNREKNFAGARDAFRSVISLDSSKYVVWQQLLQLESELEDYQAMLSESSRALELFPEQAELYLFNGMAFFKMKKYPEAIKVLKSGKNFVLSDDLLLLRFYILLGDCFYKTGEFTLSFDSFEKGLKIDNKNIYILNNYSYYLALQKTNLDRAAELAAKLNELLPGIASYEDTYAWVLYRNGKYSEAREWAEKAIKNSTVPNGVFYDHYGDILFKSNLKDQAVEYWIKAREAGINTDLLNKKINDRMLYEDQ